MDIISNILELFGAAYLGDFSKYMFQSGAYSSVFYVMLFLFDGLATIGWVGLVWRNVVYLPKIWIIAAPLLTALIGQIFELIPFPFKGIGSGFETLGWMLMFVGGIIHIRNCKVK